VIAVAFGVAAIAAYLFAFRAYMRRYPHRAFSPLRAIAFVAGCALLTAALLPWADARADSSFAAHMLQHIVMLLIAPPLILLGAPLLLAIAASPRDVARKITGFANSSFGHALFSPVTAWLLYVFVLWGAHFSPLYELALEYPAVHVFEHVLFIGSALLFWNAVVQVGYAPRPVPYAARMFYLFLAIPQGAFLGFALNATRSVLYPHYASTLGSAALEDQHSGADIMWILGGFLLFVSFMCTAGAWAAAERRTATS
jgi:cytochrome c oxidase assembly factor CtaG